MPLSIDENDKISHTNAMFERLRAQHSQRFQVRLEVGPWPSNQTVAIPYPTRHPLQQVREIHTQSDGRIQDHHGFIVITHGSWATITAEITTHPFLNTPTNLKHTNQPVASADHLYLQPDQFMQNTDPAIAALAQQLVPQPNQPPLQTLKTLFDYTKAHLRYGNPIPGLYSSSDATQLSCVDCGGFSTYLGALCRACGIPSRLVAGFWAGYRRNEMHAWLEALLPDGTWWPMDASVDWLRNKHRTSKRGGFGELGSDRIVISVGSNHIIRNLGREYVVGMLQLPLILNPDGTTIHLDRITRIVTQRV